MNNVLFIQKLGVRESRVTVSAQEIYSGPLKITNSRPISTFIKTIILFVEKKEEGGI
mgnify:CR=1 FL=1